MPRSRHTFPRSYHWRTLPATLARFFPNPRARCLRMRLFLLLLALPWTALPSAWLSPGRAQAQELTPAERPSLAVENDPTPKPRIKTSGAAGKPAVFQSPSHVQAAQVAIAQSADDWTPDFQDDFESLQNNNWIVSDQNTDPYQKTWGLSDYYAHSGRLSLWAGGGGQHAADPYTEYYPANLDAWLVTNGYFDMTTVQTALVEFYMWLDTEPNYDWIFVGASVDGVNYYGQYWTGWSGGWQSFAVDLVEFAGHSQVTLAWYFHSDSDNGGGLYEGVWLDDVTVWTYVNSGPQQGANAIQNGDFESGNLAGWTTAGRSVAVHEAAGPAGGRYVAALGGVANAEDILAQSITLPGEETTGATIRFWLNFFGTEDQARADFFCAALADSGGAILVDLGCLDGVEAAPQFSPSQWWQVEVPLSGEQWFAVQGKQVNLLFGMFTDGDNHTTTLIDDVQLELISGGVDSDRLEPNNSLAQASPVTLAAPVMNLTIAPAGDVDLFQLSAATGDTVVVDVDAAVNGSRLDAITILLDANGQPVLNDNGELCANDDDGHTLDSFLTCTVGATGSYYVAITSYDGSGDRTYSYSVTIYLNPGEDGPTPDPDGDREEPPPNSEGRAWTAIVYISGDNNLCVLQPERIRRMETELAAKIGPNGFLNLVVLFDASDNPAHGCNGQGGTTRYVVQPNGAYTQNVNRWDMGELNMGDPQTLIQFVNWAMQNYPADHYYLALDNHGGGIDGIAEDVTDHDILLPDELYSALKEITRNGQRKFDLIAFEACLMGMVENAYDVRGFADYLLFFPTISWGSTRGSYPSYFGDSRFTANSSGFDLANIAYEVYYNTIAGVPYVISLVDTAKMDAVKTALDAWTEVLLLNLPVRHDTFTASRSRAQKVERSGDVLNDADPYVDLWDLADDIAQQGFAIAEANALKRAIDEAVVRFDIRGATAQYPWDYTESHGLTIYWPQTPSGLYQLYVNDQLYNLSRDGRWDDYLRAYFGDGANLSRSALPVAMGAVQRPIFEDTLPAAPAAPSLLTATATGPRAVDLSWTDNATNESNYVVERSPDGETWTVIATLPADSTNHEDHSGLRPQKRYHYRVQATNSGGASEYSEVVAVQTPAATGEIRGILFLDANRNQKQDRHEPGLAGITVRVVSTDGHTQKQVVTGADGRYTLGELPVGSYRLSVILPPGYVATTAGTGAAPVTVQISEAGVTAPAIGLVHSLFVPNIQKR